MTLNRTRGSRWPRSWWLWVGYWLGLFVSTHVSLPGKGAMPVPHGDKVIHFGVYFLLTWLGGRHRLTTGRSLPMAVLLAWAAVYTAYAAGDEWLQQYTGRTMCLGDWLADLAGIATATATLALRRRSSGLSEPGRHA